MADAGIASYYDRLSRWNATARFFGYGGGRASLTVHRPLADPRARGRATTTRIHDILAEHLPALDGGLALDAGCGLGGTMLDLSPRLGARFVGLTLSPTQAATAVRAAAHRGMRIQVVVGDYDHPPPGPFQLIVAIESLAHSAAPEVSLSALTASLAPGGLFAVVDDMPEARAQTSADFDVFTAGWQCRHLLSHEAYREAFSRLGLEMVVDRDLTADSRPRAFAAIAALMALNRAAARLTFGGLRQVLASHLGGLALERLTRQGLVRYRLLIARKRERTG